MLRHKHGVCASLGKIGAVAAGYRKSLEQEQGGDAQEGEKSGEIGHEGDEDG